MNSDDTDFRYMATNDLMSGLTDGSLGMDANTERRVVDAILKQLSDKNGEVQNLAVKCLGPLVKKIHEVQLQTLIDQLSVFTAQDKDELRDIANLGLKTVIADIPATSPLAPGLCRRLIPKLLTQLTKTDKQDHQMETVEVLSELLSKFGSVLPTISGLQASIQKTLLPLLDHPRAAMRKRATVAIGSFSAQSPDDLFKSLMTDLLAKLDSNASFERQRTFIQCAGTISRNSSARTGEYMQLLVPLILKAVDQNDDELREVSFQALETFLLRCPAQLTPFVNKIIDASLQYIKYDPNYAVDEDEEAEGDDEELDDASEAMDEDDDQDDIDDASDYSDDDDMSWKVRRCASKTLAAVIETRLDLLTSMYNTIAPVLINRFKEREESVRVDIIQTFITLLRQTQSQISSSEGHHAETKKLESMDIDSSSSPRHLLTSQVAKIVKNLTSQMNAKSSQTCQVGFELLRELVQVLHGGLEKQVGLVISPLKAALSSTESSHHSGTSNLKIEALAFEHELLRLHHADIFQQYLNDLVAPVTLCIRDKFYKIVTEALLVGVELVKVIRPLDLTTHEKDIKQLSVPAPKPAPTAMPLLGEVFRATYERLGTADADLEIKEKGISSLGYILAQAGDLLEDTYAKCLPLLLERLRNEVTRLAAVKAITVMAQSPVCKGDQIKSFMLECLDEVAALLRKNNRQLKAAAYSSLSVLVARYGESLSPEAYQHLTHELRPLLSDVDLHLLPMSLAMITSLLKANADTTYPIIRKDIMPAVFKAVQSPLVQGAALQNILMLLQTIITYKPSEFGFLFAGLTTSVASDVTTVQRSSNTANGDVATTSKQAYSTIAQGVAVICVGNAKHTSDTVSDLLKKVQDAKSSDTIKYFSLLTLGEIGNRTDLSGVSKLYDTVLAAFSDTSEEIKSAAAFALGNISAGKIEKFLPLIIDQIHKDSKKRYLLLHALKEIITRYSNSKGAKTLQVFADQIWTPLFQEAENEDESTRNVTAECLGKLTLTGPFKYLPELEKRLQSSSPQVRGTVITAIKYTFTDEASTYDELLGPLIVQFLSLIKDDNLTVRRLSLATLNSAAHNKPYLIRDHLDNLMPLLYQETQVKPELIHTVEMGPFKMKVDDGLEARKTAYECMFTLIETCFERVEVFGFLDRIAAALEDQQEIKVLAHFMLMRLAVLAPTAVAQKLDDQVEAFAATLAFKLKPNAVKQEVDKNVELQRSTLRCIASLSKLNDPARTPRFDTFLKEVRAGPFCEEYRAIVREGTTNGDAMDLS